MITIDAKELQRLNLGLGQYARYSGRTATLVVAAKAQQLLLGVGAGPMHKDGLYGLLAETAPAPGSIGAARETDSYRLGRRDSTSVSWARERANSILKAGESGIFQGTTLGQIYTRGAKKGQIGFGRKSKTSVRAVGFSRASATERGGNLMNRQALLVALAIKRRESSRLASAVQFLPSRYRSLLSRLAGRKFTDSGIDQVSEKVTVQNKKGSELGSLGFTATAGDALAKIVGDIGLYTPAQRAAMSEAIRLVVNDMAIYTARKMEEAGKAALPK